MRKYINIQNSRRLAIFCTALIPVAVLSYHEKLSIGDISSLPLFLILVLMLIFSNLEIPVYRMRTKKPVHLSRDALALEHIYAVPVLEELSTGSQRTFDTAVTVNAGGFIVPLIALLYLLSTHLTTVALLLTLIMIIAVVLISEMISGVGVVIPDHTPLIAIPFALMVDPSHVAEITYISAIAGIFIGTLVSILTFNREKKGVHTSVLEEQGTFRLYTSQYLSQVCYLILSDRNSSYRLNAIV